VSTNAECAHCGMTLDEASEFLFDHDGNTILCQGCA
jgi:ribosomal protein S27E